MGDSAPPSAALRAVWLQRLRAASGGAPSASLYKFYRFHAMVQLRLRQQQRGTRAQRAQRSERERSVASAAWLAQRG